MPFIKTILNTLPRPFLLRVSTHLRPLLDLYYRGHTFTDPINGKSYRKFLPYGYLNIRRNALSPGTLSLERHRLLWLFLEMKTDLFTHPYRVLHIAPEQALMKPLNKMPHLKYITADLHSPLADIKADILSLPFEDESFDVVLCNHVLEHIPDDRKAMSELYRVMKPGGWGVFQVPLDNQRATTYENPDIVEPGDREKHFGQYDHVRVYGRDYFDRLRQTGFEVQEVDMSEVLTPGQFKRYALPGGETIPFCRKKSNGKSDPAQRE